MTATLLPLDTLLADIRPICPLCTQPVTVCGAFESGICLTCRDHTVFVYLCGDTNECGIEHATHAEAEACLTRRYAGAAS